jgi:hypothetical protein
MAEDAIDKNNYAGRFSGTGMHYQTFAGSWFPKRILIRISDQLAPYGMDKEDNFYRWAMMNLNSLGF